MTDDRTRRAYEILSELQAEDRPDPAAVEDLVVLGEKAIPAMREALALRNPILRRIAATALARLGSPAALPALLPLLESPQDDLVDIGPVLVRGAGEAAGRLRAQLEPRSSDRDPGEHPQAAGGETADGGAPRVPAPGDPCDGDDAGTDRSQPPESAVSPAAPEEATDGPATPTTEHTAEGDHDEAAAGAPADEPGPDSGAASGESPSEGAVSAEPSRIATSRSARIAAVSALLDRTVAVLELHAHDRSPFMRAAVADACARIAMPTFGPLLVNLANDVDGFVAERAREALTNLPAASRGGTPEPAETAGGTVSPDSTAPLNALLADLVSPDPRRRRAAQEGLVAHPERDDAVLRYMGASHAPLRRAVLELLGEFEVPVAAERLQTLLDAAWPDREDLVLLLHAAARHRLVEPAFLDRQVRRFLMHHDPVLRAALAGLIAMSRGPQLDVLPRLLRDHEYLVREQAARGWLRVADRSRARIIPEVLDLVADVLAQPELFREDVLLLALLFAGLRRAAENGAFIEARAASLAARALGGPWPGLRRRAAELLTTLVQLGAISDPGAGVRTDALLLSGNPQEVELALLLLEASTAQSLPMHMAGMLRFLYRADDGELRRLIPLLARARTRDAWEALRQVERSHPDLSIRSLASEALASPAPETSFPTWPGGRRP